jgi:hypothetical protein
MTPNRSALALACGLFAVTAPALAADLGPGAAYVEPIAPADVWKFSFTPYGWFTGINGNVTARGHTVEVDESFIDIAEKSNSFAALMGYFEARKGRFGFFTDAVWADLGFPGHVNYDINRTVSGNPFARLPDFKVTIRGNLKIDARAQLDYQETIIQSGVAFEVAKWGARNGPGFTALDVLGSARYWNQDVDLSLKIDGTLTADIEADFQRLGLKVQRKVKGSRFVAVARSNELEWVDPVVGARLRHQFASGSEFNLLGDVGGFGAGSEFSWQAVATYGFDVNMFGSTMRSVVGYRALSVDYSENGQHGKNGLDWIQHGPILGVAFRW